MTQKELEEKRAKNLCFYCDQRYTPGHKYSGQVYSLEVSACVDDEESNLLEESERGCLEEVIQWPPTQNTDHDIVPQISLNAITRVYNFQTMRVSGYVSKFELHILVDSGSTYNFLDIGTAKRLGCEIRKTYPLQVTVARGKTMISDTICPNFTWTLQGERFSSTVILLPLGGCEMVLGIQWLSTLGEIRWNFKELRIGFIYRGKYMTLGGTSKSATQWMTGRPIVGAQCASMTLCVYPVSMLNTMELSHTFLDPLLAEYDDVFAKPKGMPPQRSHDHRIPMKEGAPIVNARPYRHPPT